MHQHEADIEMQTVRRRPHSDDPTGRPGAVAVAAERDDNRQGDFDTLLGNTTAHRKALQERGGTIFQFWICAAIGLFLNVFALPGVFGAPRLAIRYGLSFGSGISIGLASLTFPFLAPLPAWANFLLFLVGVVVAAILAFRGINGWTTVEERLGMTHTDVVVAMLISLVLVVGAFATVVYWFVGALSLAM